jgi:hypothetical protein
MKKVNKGVLRVGLVDELDNNSKIELKKLTTIGRGMVRNDLQEILTELDRLDSKD